MIRKYNLVIFLIIFVGSAYLLSNFFKDKENSDTVTENSEVGAQKNPSSERSDAPRSDQMLKPDGLMDKSSLNEQPTLNHKNKLSRIESENPASVNQEESPENAWRLGFSNILRVNISNHGLPFESAECLEEISQANVKAEKPLSFDGMVDSCSLKLSLTEKDRSKLNQVFRNSIAQAGSDINLDEWFKCASNRSIKSGTKCINEIYQDTAREFFQESVGNNLMKGYEFSRKWDSFVSKAAKKVIQECEQDSNLLTELSAHECTTIVSFPQPIVT